MLALIGNLDILELILIAAVALMVFGKRLPEVTMRGMAQVMKLRREVARMWREAGLEDELRKVRRDLEQDLPRHLPSPDELMRQAEHELEEEREIEAHDHDHEQEDELDHSPLDPLAREALATEPVGAGWYSETAEPEVESGTEDTEQAEVPVEPTDQARTEPSGEELDPEDGVDDEKESA